MTPDILYIALAIILLFFGAESLVKGSSSLALKTGLSPLTVGLTVVAFGTSSPELVVSIKAALAQQGDIAVGNVVGSNLFNIGIILGLTALICPIPVHKQIIKSDSPIALFSAVLLAVFLLNGRIGRIEGVIFFIGIAAYTWMNIAMTRRKRKIGEADSAPDNAGVIYKRKTTDIAFILGGLAVLVVGSEILVEHSVTLARALGISEAVIGLTIISAGTSMPELATSIIAALRKQPDIAIGNVIGSNIFNILGILGTASIISPISAPGISATDYSFMLIFTVLLIPLLYTGRILHRIEGVILLALYGVYLYMLWPK
jgi:cation:H+ antiporter